MEDTIFSPSFGNRPAYLVGRETTLSTLTDGLKSRPGSKERAIVLLGQRGNGKTVLLWELADRASDLGYVVATPTIASEDMLDRIIEKIDEAAPTGSALERVNGGSIGAFGFSAGIELSDKVPSSRSFASSLTSHVRAMNAKGKALLILVDELQANSPEVRKLVIAYQELVGEGLDVAMVLAGLPGAVSATLNDKVLTFLNRARKLTLEPLRISDVEAFFVRAFGELGVVVDASSCARAAKMTQGSPYLLQLVGHQIVVSADADGRLADAAIERALVRAQEEFETDVCETTLAALSQRDMDYLRAMLPDTGSSKTSDVAERLGVTPDYAQVYRKRLLAAGVIKAPMYGSVAFNVPYLADYLRRSGE